MERLRIGGAQLETGSDLIRYVQNQLWLRAYGITRTDGELDPDTQTAVAAYQRDAGIDPDGVITESLADHLSSTGRHKLRITNGMEITTNLFMNYARLESEYNLEQRPLRVSGRSFKFKPTGRGTFCGVPPRYAAASQCYSAEAHVLGDLTVNGDIIFLASGLVLMKGSQISIDR